MLILIIRILRRICRCTAACRRGGRYAHRHDRNFDRKQQRAVELAEKYPNVFAVIGVHPTYAEEAEDDVIDSAARTGEKPARGRDR